MENKNDWGFLKWMLAKNNKCSLENTNRNTKIRALNTLRKINVTNKTIALAEHN